MAQATAQRTGPVKAMRSVRTARYPWAVNATAAPSTMASLATLSRSRAVPPPPADTGGGKSTRPNANGRNALQGASAWPTAPT